MFIRTKIDPAGRQKRLRAILCFWGAYLSKAMSFAGLENDQ